MQGSLEGVSFFFGFYAPPSYHHPNLFQDFGAHSSEPAYRQSRCTPVRLAMYIDCRQPGRPNPVLLCLTTCLPLLYRWQACFLTPLAEPVVPPLQGWYLRPPAQLPPSPPPPLQQRPSLLPPSALASTSSVHLQLLSLKNRLQSCSPSLWCLTLGYIFVLKV
jgi:hypothetical protein